MSDAMWFSAVRQDYMLWAALLWRFEHETDGPLEWALILLLTTSFGAVAFAKSLFPHWSNHPAAAGLRVYEANVFYVNALFDRLIGGC